MKTAELDAPPFLLFLGKFDVDVSPGGPDQGLGAILQFEPMRFHRGGVYVEGMGMEGLVRDFVPVKNLAGVTVEEFALVGKADAGAAAVQEFCPEFVLEIGNILGYRRLGDVQ